LKFEKAGEVNVTLDVRDIGATSPGSNRMDRTMPDMKQPMKMSPDHKM